LSPLISVIIPCYNQAQFLSDAIRSVVSQSWENWECIIVNDGSTDDTREVSLTFSRNDPRIHYLEQHNQGLSAARNTGLQAASGNFIQFLDCDDTILSTKLAEQIALISETRSPSVSICDFYYHAENDASEIITLDSDVTPHLNGLDPVADLILRWEDGLSIPAHCFLFDARLFESIRFDISLPNHEDWDCWINIFRQSPSVFFLNKPLAAYRLHESSMSTNKPNMYAGFLTAIKHQKSTFKSTDRLFKLLSDKESAIKKCYRKEKKYINFQKRKNNKLIRMLKNNTPWPIQKAVAQLKKLKS